MLHIENVSKSINGIPILTNVCLSCGQGEVYALLGPNGVGKTSLLRCIIGTYTYQGKIYSRVNPGISEESSRMNFLGVHTDDSALYGEYTIKQNVSLFKRFYANHLSESDIQSLAEQFEILPYWNKKVETLSTGVKKKSSLLRSLVGRPRLILWDEPFANLDPEGVKVVKNVICEQKKMGNSVLLCSHDLPYCEQICDRLSFMFLGKPVHEFSGNELRIKYPGQSLEQAYFLVKGEAL
jgi:ABC-2 type transport system ATP-binding protein